MVKKYDKVPELTAEKAYKEYNETGLSYQQIAEKYSTENESISHVTVRNRVIAFNDGKTAGKEEGKEEGINEVKSNPEEYNLKESLDDEETSNPYTENCPNCNNEMEKPNSPKVVTCETCGKQIKFTENDF